MEVMLLLYFCIPYYRHGVAVPRASAFDHNAVFMFIYRMLTLSWTVRVSAREVGLPGVGDRLEVGLWVMTALALREANTTLQYVIQGASLPPDEVPAVCRDMMAELAAE